MSTRAELAEAYLGGYWKAVGDRQIFDFLRSGSEEETKARRALAHILRNGRPTPTLLHLLASLIDPIPQRFQHRRFDIVARGSGAPPTYGRDLAIAKYCVERRRSRARVKAAISEAAELYGVSIGKARRARERYSAMFERGKMLK